VQRDAGIASDRLLKKSLPNITLIDRFVVEFTVTSVN
jgi:hypothetical protein